MKTSLFVSADCVLEVLRVDNKTINALCFSMFLSNLFSMSSRNVEYYGGLMLDHRLIEFTFDFFRIDLLVFTFNNQHNSPKIV